MLKPVIGLNSSPATWGPVPIPADAMTCQVSVADMADRPPRVLADGEVIDIGGKRLRYIELRMFPTAGMSA
jgi:hypothetical protein